MPERTATAVAHPNIALIKYWGDLDPELHIPANGSISMNLAELFTHTRVQFKAGSARDNFVLNDKPADIPSTERVSAILNRIRHLARIDAYAQVDSQNNFPAGVGIASSASGFAALSLAAASAAGLELDEKALSRLARTGSGSACRSIPAGFVEWQSGGSDIESFAYSIAPPEHWDLVDCIAVVSQEEKRVSSSTGHTVAHTSLLQSARLNDAPQRLKICREALLQRDFDSLAEVVELDSNLMHAVMITSNPPLFYWQPETIRTIQAVQSMRKAGLPVCFSVDAGPNVHVLCTVESSKEVEERLGQVPGVMLVIVAHPGGPARTESRE